MAGWFSNRGSFGFLNVLLKGHGTIYADFPVLFGIMINGNSINI